MLKKIFLLAFTISSTVLCRDFSNRTMRIIINGHSYEKRDFISPEIARIYASNLDTIKQLIIDSETFEVIL